MEQLIAQLIWLGISYLIGAIPFGLIIAKSKQGIDLRQVGSGNIGATNVARTCGFFYGLCTFLLDMLKGIISVAIAFKLSANPIFISLAAISVIVGHMYSVFLNYNGGKGVATTIGIYLILNPCALIISAIISLLIIYLTGYVSLGSIILVMVMVIFMLFQKGFIYFILSLIIMLLVINKHKDNVVRVLKGQENTWKKKI
ncbi:hypothetical protein JCM12298_00960 [Desulfothermus naphthae]